VQHHLIGCSSKTDEVNTTKFSQKLVWISLEAALARDRDDEVQLSRFLPSSPCCRACNISPSGTGDLPGEIPISQIDALQANGDLPYLWLSMVGAASDNIVANYETPIQFRHANIVGMNSYNVLAPYQPEALDIWGRGTRRICVDELSAPGELNAHEQVTGAYVFE
jgi:hypothetical protein